MSARTRNSRARRTTSSAFRSASASRSPSDRHEARRPSTLLHRASTKCFAQEEKLDVARATVRCSAASSGKTLSPDAPAHLACAGERRRVRRVSCRLAARQQGCHKRADGRSSSRRIPLGVATNRDEVVYDFQASFVGERVQAVLSRTTTPKSTVTSEAAADRASMTLCDYDKIKWSRDLKANLAARPVRRVRRSQDPHCACTARSASSALSSTTCLNEDVYQFPQILSRQPTQERELQSSRQRHRLSRSHSVP